MWRELSCCLVHALLERDWVGLSLLMWLLCNLRVLHRLHDCFLITMHMLLRPCINNRIGPFLRPIAICIGLKLMFKKTTKICDLRCKLRVDQWRVLLPVCLHWSKRDVYLVQLIDVVQTIVHSTVELVAVLHFLPVAVDALQKLLLVEFVVQTGPSNLGGSLVCRILTICIRQVTCEQLFALLVWLLIIIHHRLHFVRARLTKRIDKFWLAAFRNWFVEKLWLLWADSLFYLLPWCVWCF